MLQNTCCRQTGGLRDLMRNLPAFQRVEQVDVPHAAIEHAERQLSTTNRRNRSGHLMGVHAVAQAQVVRLHEIQRLSILVYPRI